MKQPLYRLCVSKCFSVWSVGGSVLTFFQSHSQGCTRTAVMMTVIQPCVWLISKCRNQSVYSFNHFQSYIQIQQKTNSKLKSALEYGFSLNSWTFKEFMEFSRSMLYLLFVLHSLSLGFILLSPVRQSFSGTKYYRVIPTLKLGEVSSCFSNLFSFFSKNK